MRDAMNAITRFIPETAPSAPVHDVYSLTRGGNLAQIVLDGKTYQLRITRAGKLILTK
jgi:hemin uptake protein HemP